MNRATQGISSEKTKLKRQVKQELIPAPVLQEVLTEQKRIISLSEWKSFSSSWDRLDRTVSSFPLNPRFNAVYWAFDVYQLCHQIRYGLIWMNAYATFYKSKVKAGSEPSHTDFLVTYFADDCISRIDSCQDKLALLVWAFYSAFNPENREEVLVYEDVIRRLRCPVKFGLNLTGHEKFLGHLDLLQGDDFQKIKRYRDMKIHRREPMIEVYNPQPHQKLPYTLPLTEPKEIDAWKTQFARQYPDPSSRQIMEKHYYIKGVLYDQRELKDRVWGFADVRGNIESCLRKLLKVSAGCFIVLKRKSPFRRVREQAHLLRRPK